MTVRRWQKYAQVGLLALPLLGLAYLAWDRHRRPSERTYEGRTLKQWIEDLSGPDYPVSDPAAEVLASAGGDAVPLLLAAREQGDLRLHRRAAAVLVRIGKPAAPGLVAGLKDGPNERVEIALIRLGPEAVPALVEALKDEKHGKEASRVLGLMGPRAAEAVPALLEVLRQRRAVAGLREEAAGALGRIGTPATAIVPALSAALKDDNVLVRQYAAEALGWIGPPARAAVPALVAALKDEKPEVAAVACLSLTRLEDPGVSQPLFEVFRGGRSVVADKAGLALWHLGAAAKPVVPAVVALLKGTPQETARVRTLLLWLGPIAVPHLIAALGDEEPAIRQAAAQTLGQIGPLARASIPALTNALRDRDPAVALAAALALPQIDPTRAGDAVMRLTDALDHATAAEALAEIGPDARAAVPALIAALKNRDPALRSAAAHALACIGSPAVAPLLDALKDSSEEVPSLAATALGSILPPAKEAIPALRAALESDRARTAAYALALVQIDPSQAGAMAVILQEELKAPDRGRQVAAIQALGQLGSAARSAVPALAERLKDADMLDATLAALRQLGPEAAEAVPILLARLRDPGQNEALKIGDVLAHIGPPAIPRVAELLQDPNVEYRRFAVFVLAQFGKSAREALAPLMRALKDPDSQVAAGAAHALEEIGRDARPAVPALIENLYAFQSQVRGPAAVALGHIGPDAREARAPLRECLMDPDKGVRYAAALALGRIDPQNTDAIPAIRDALHDADPEVRLAAVDSLSHIDKERIKETIPVLLAVSEKPYYLSTRLKGVEGLADLAPEKAKAALPLLERELSNPDPGVRLPAALLLERIEPTRASAIALALASNLRDRDPGVRGTMAHALGLLGKRAREAVPALMPLLHDEVPAVRQEASKALMAMDATRAKRLGLPRK